MEFNKTHPELEAGEMFILNEENNSNAMVTFNSLPYKTKRYGQVAYDDSGNVLENTRPIFIKTEEFISHMNKDMPKSKKAFYVGTNHGSFRKNEPAEIIGVVFVTPLGLASRACYHIRYKDGKEDFTPISESDNFKILSEEEVGQLVQ